MLDVDQETNVDGEGVSAAPDLRQGVSRLFRSYQKGLSMAPATDELGFVVASPELVTFDKLQKQRAILIVGPPWVGKTFVANQIKSVASRDEHTFFTPFEA